MAHVEVNGVSLHYEIRGNGTPLILIHPPVLSSANFHYQLDELAKYFTVIVFDIRGHGKSQPSVQAVTYPLIVEDIKGLLNHLHIEKAFVCGYSVGGSIALEFLLTAPERSLGAILVGGISEVNSRRLRNLISLAVALAGAGAIPALACSISWSNSDTMETFWELLKDAKKADKRNAEQYYRYSLTYNCTDQLRTIPFPVLLVYGGDDTQFQSYGRLIRDNVAHSEFVLIPNVKHQIPTKKHAELNRLIKQFILKQKGQN
ncbi:alpha/beta fold hydrolase [Aneurinibacillus soli]|nr:alpha/beta hydrolase [Aneurinibacillus soli]